MGSAILILSEVVIVSNCADSNITTQIDRYLMIVTSGGLNQQRTGVSVSFSRNNMEVDGLEYRAKHVFNLVIHVHAQFYCPITL